MGGGNINFVDFIFSNNFILRLLSFEVRLRLMDTFVSETFALLCLKS